MGQLTQPRRVRPIRRSRPRRAPGPPYERYSLKVYTGHSAVEMPIQEAYAAAGLKMAE